MAAIVLDKSTFFRRIKKVYSEWKVKEISPQRRRLNLNLPGASLLSSPQEPSFKHDDALRQVDCIMTVVGVDEEILYSKSHALQVRRNPRFPSPHSSTA